MKTVLKWIGRLILVLVLISIPLGIWQRDRLAQLHAVLTLYAPERIVGNFSSMEDTFPTVEMPLPPGPPTELPQGEEMSPPDGFDAWLEASDVTAIVVLKDGAIRLERYPLSDPDRTDDPAERRRMSFSLAKSFLSILTGVLVEEGAIDSLDDPVTKYAPDLAGTAYDGASFRDVLQMSSGVTFDEDYLEFSSDINRMSRTLAFGGSMDDFTLALTETFAEPGTDWQYVSIDTHVVGLVLRGATGRSIPDLMNEKVLAPLSLSVEPRYITDGEGTAFVLGGLLMATRDYALFGHMVANEGEAFGTRIVSADWIEESTAPSAPTDAGEIGYGYQWWIPEDAWPGEVMGRGIYGQYLYVDRTRDIVIAVNAADREFREDGVHGDNLAMLREIAGELE